MGPCAMGPPVNKRCADMLPTEILFSIILPEYRHGPDPSGS